MVEAVWSRRWLGIRFGSVFVGIRLGQCGGIKSWPHGDPDVVVVSNTLAPGHWLGNRARVYVSEDLAEAAKAKWPNAPMVKPIGRGRPGWLRWPWGRRV